jgi:hypothetical protein
MTVTAAGLLYFMRDPRQFDLSAGAMLLVALTWALPFVMYPLNQFGLPISPPVLVAAFALAAKRIGWAEQA